uniref:Uncharacterized protein n=1 Tax=Opuntia streptacantha TaxID=393608 RepID=A0A7C9D698_OPUST
MPAEHPAEKCFIWIVSAFLFICVSSGGALLVLYLCQPETSTSSWYPVVGILLVCLPWLFWFVTFLYRLLSRKLGFRMVCWGTDVHPVDGANVRGTGGSFANRDGNATGHGEPTSSNLAEYGGSTGEAGQGSSHGKSHSLGGATISSRDSHESETPLKLSMAS